MTFILFTLIFLLIVLFISEPLLKGKRRVTSSDHDSRLYAEKERIYSLIKDLESDLQSSKISEEDYNSLRNQYMSQAVEILKEIEDLPEKKRMRSHSLDEKVNQLIEQERGRKKTVGSSRKQ